MKWGRRWGLLWGADQDEEGQKNGGTKGVWIPPEQPRKPWHLTAMGMAILSVGSKTIIREKENDDA